MAWLQSLGIHMLNHTKYIHWFTGEVARNTHTTKLLTKLMVHTP